MNNTTIVNYQQLLNNLAEALKQKIFENVKELTDDQIYQIVSQLPDFENESKKLLLEVYKENNNIEDPNEKIKQPEPDLFDVLKDSNLKTYINRYKIKSLEERKKDPLRKVFQWNANTTNYNLNRISDIKKWFKNFMTLTDKEKDKDDNYFVLLELFGKDFEFGGSKYGSIPKAKLWDKVDEQEVKAWYKKNKIQTDLFDDLQIEEEKIVITEKKRTTVSIQPLKKINSMTI